MMESTVSFPAVFFAAIIGVIIFIALSAVMLEPPSDAAAKTARRDRATPRD